MSKEVLDRNLFDQLFAAFRKIALRDNEELDKIEMRETPITITTEDVSTPKGLCERSEEILTTEDSSDRCEKLGGLSTMLAELDELNHRKDFLVRTIAEANRLHDETDSNFVRSNIKIMIGVHQRDLGVVRESMRSIRSHLQNVLRNLSI